MTQQSPSELEAARRRRGRGVHFKPFPTVSFEDALLLPKGIAQYGVDGEMERRALFAELKRAPESGRSKALVTNAVKYGLIVRKRPGDLLASPTAAGWPWRQRGVPWRRQCGSSWPWNSFGLQRPLRKAERPALSRRPGAEGRAGQRRRGRGGPGSGGGSVCGEPAFPGAGSGQRRHGLCPRHRRTPRCLSAKFRKDSPESPVAAAAKRPALHIDIQVHIDPTASAEQIDHIFASMARHFYGDEA